MSARIAGIAVPDTIQLGGGFNAIIETEDYIQSVYDVAIVFGVSPGAGYPGSLGNVFDSFYLGPEESNVLYNITKWTTLPPSTPMGESHALRRSDEPIRRWLRTDRRLLQRLDNRGRRDEHKLRLEHAAMSGV